MSSTSIPALGRYAGAGLLAQLALGAHHVEQWATARCAHLLGMSVDDLLDPDGPDTWTGTAPDEPHPAWTAWQGPRALVHRNPIADCAQCGGRSAMGRSGLWGHVEFDPEEDSEHDPVIRLTEPIPGHYVEVELPEHGQHTAGVDTVLLDAFPDDREMRTRYRRAIGSLPAEAGRLAHEPVRHAAAVYAVDPASLVEVLQATGITVQLPTPEDMNRAHEEVAEAGPYGEGDLDKLNARIRSVARRRGISPELLDEWVLPRMRRAEV